jgi:tripartite-type tricarboxylate transporter receptor subunit TctC
VRGEIDGRCGTHLNTIRSLHPDWVGPPPKFTVPAIVAAKRRPDYPDTPTVLEFVKDDFTRARLQLLMVPQTLNRPVLAPPNVPAERVKELRAAFDATMTDPAFLAEIAKKHLEVNPSDAAEVTKVIGEAYAMPPKVIAGFRELITP